MSIKKHLISSGLLLIVILIFGFNHRTGAGNKDIIIWSEKQLEWENFELVRSIENEYVATIYSDIFCPNLITEGNSEVHAYMDPNISERLINEYDSENVLVHEQYHFNITEYCARLLRKELVTRGLGGLSLKTIKDLKTKYDNKLDSLQNAYDSITDHNVNWDQQRYWELKIDDWLRETSYYVNEDIYAYYDFTKNPTRFFRHVYFTHTNKVLTSYPVSEEDINYGEIYEILFPKHKEKTIRFYKNGKLTNGGVFDTAITKIIEDNEGNIQMQYLNADETPNTQLEYSFRKTIVHKNKDRTIHYLNANRERISQNSIYETKWKYNAKENSYYSTYFNIKGKTIPNKSGMYHEKRALDKKERTILFAGFNKRHQPKNDKEHIARWELEFNEQNKKTYYKLYDEDGEPAYHLSDYHLAYAYDERGNIIKVSSLDKNGNATYDDNGASIYEYTYDLYNRDIGIKRFNTYGDPIVANDDYFQHIKRYDSLGRIAFEALYYPLKVLKYNNTKWGATRYSYKGDSIIKKYNIDAYGDIVLNDNNVAIVKSKCDKKGQVVSETYLDVDGSFAKMEDGVVSYAYKYDDNGNRIESRAYDSIGNLKEFEADVALVRWAYDKNGHKSKTTYFNSEEQLAKATENVTYNFYEHNRAGQLLERANYDIDMNPASFDGAYKQKFLLNRAGLDSIKYEYGTNGKLKPGVAITKFYYNKYNNKVKTEYYDASFERTKNEEGISATKIIYNPRQSVTAYHYLDENDRPTNNTQGVSIKEWELNELGHTVSLRYLDNGLGAVIGPDGYHKIVYTWAPVGESTKTEIFGPDLSPIADDKGVAVYEYTLRPSGLYSEVKRYNSQGKLANNTHGVAITTYTPYLDGLYYLEEERRANGEVVQDSIAK